MLILCEALWDIWVAAGSERVDDAPGRVGALCSRPLPQRLCMFPTSSLFGLCPLYPTCPNRGFPPCLFSHSKPQPPSTLASPASSLPQKRPNDAKEESTAKRRAAPALVVQTKTVEVKTSDRTAKEGNPAPDSRATKPPSARAAAKDVVEANVNASALAHSLTVVGMY